MITLEFKKKILRIRELISGIEGYADRIDMISEGEHSTDHAG